jgi:hypothetical protein
MTDMQDQIRPTHHDLNASAKAQYDPAISRAEKSPPANKFDATCLPCNAAKLQAYPLNACAKA